MLKGQQQQFSNSLPDSLSGDTGVAAPAALNVLTSADTTKRYARLLASASIAALMTGFVATTAPLSLGLIAATAAAYTAVRATRRVTLQYIEPSDRDSTTHDVPAFAPRAMAYFAKLTQRETPTVVRLNADDDMAQASCSSHTLPRIGFTTALERETDKLSLAAIFGHEMGHATHDNKSLDDASSALLRSARVLRWSMIAGMATSAIPATPALLGVAIGAPLVMHMLHKAGKRHNELINDRFSAIAMGSPVPMARAFAQHERSLKQQKANPTSAFNNRSLFVRGLHLLRTMEDISLVSEHPSRNARRKALTALRKNGMLKVQDSQIKTLRAQFD